MRKVFIPLMTVAIVAGLVFSGCMQEAPPEAPPIAPPEAPPPAPPAAEPWKVGFFGSLTNDQGRTGWRMTKAIIEEWNEKGGLLGRPIEYCEADTHMDVAEAIRALEYLVEIEHVDIISSSCLDDESMGILPRIAEYKVPFIDTWTSAFDVIEVVRTDYDNMKSYFMTCPDDYILAQSWTFVAEELFHKQAGWNTTVIMGEDTAYGHGVSDYLQEVLPTIGIEVQDVIFIDIETTDYTPIWESLVARDPQPDFVFYVLSGNPIPPIAQYVENEYPIPAAGVCNEIARYEFWEDVGGLGEGMGTFWQVPNIGMELDPWTQEIWDRYQAVAGGRLYFPDFNAWHTYFGLDMAFESAEAVGGFEPLDAWVEEMERHTISVWRQGGRESAGPDDEVWLHFEFYALGEIDPLTDHNPVHNWVYDRSGKEGYLGSETYIQWQEGEPVLIYPELYATGEFKLPHWLR
jgi:ABC-type branched-subunit amino acid transport system substrate-binding protein